MVKPSRLSSPSEPSLYSSWTDHPGHHQHHLHHHPGSDGHHQHANHSDEQHAHHQVAMKNGVAGPPVVSMLNLWNSSSSSSANSGNNNSRPAVTNNNEDNSAVEDANEDDNNDTSASSNHAAIAEHNDLSQAALSPSAIGSIKGKFKATTTTKNGLNKQNHSCLFCFKCRSLTKERKVLHNFFFTATPCVCVRDPHPKKTFVYVFFFLCSSSKRESLSSPSL